MKVPQQLNEGKTVFPTKSAGTIENPYANKQKNPKIRKQTEPPP